jgi:hypothetical protein
MALEAQRVLDRVDRIAERSQPPDEGEGISQNELTRLCGCGKRKLRELRDRPDQLAEFTLDRTGQTYEFRDGRYFPVRG